MSEAAGAGPAWADARGEIDRIDREIVALLAARRRVVAGLAQQKRAAGADPVDPVREATLRARWSGEAAAAGLPEAVALSVLDAVLAASRAHVRAVTSGEAPDDAPGDANAEKD